MTDDLKARLVRIETGDGGSNWHRNPDGPEALARIEELEAQLEVARNGLNTAWADRDMHARRAEKAEAARDQYAERVEELTAERDRFADRIDELVARIG